MEKLGQAALDPRNFPAFFILMAQGKQMGFDLGAPTARYIDG